MEASAEVSGNHGKLLPKAGQASYDDVVVTSPWLYRARSLLGKEVDVPHGEHPKEGTSQGRKVVTHHILTVPAKNNTARGSWLTHVHAHRHIFVLYIELWFMSLGLLHFMA